MRIIVIASLLALSGCGLWGKISPFSPASEESVSAQTAAPSSGKLVITKATWAAFENYKFWLTPVKWDPLMGEGYFAVAQDGRSWGLTGCTANVCQTGTLNSQDAITACQSRSGGVPCVLFARDQDPIVAYEIAD
jgi:hypothetical protein